jgi:hypothetical protein
MRVAYVAAYTTGGGGGGTGPVTGFDGLCVDVRGANSANSTPVQVYTCNGTNAQQWAVVQAGSTLQALGKCLDDTGSGGSGTQPRIWACTDGANQQWQLP